MYDIKLRVQLLKKENGFKPWLYDITIDACQFIRKPSNAIIIFFIKQIQNFTNFLDQKCPLIVSFQICML